MSLGFEGAVATTDPAGQDALTGGVYASMNGVIAAMQFIAAPLLLGYLPVGAVWVALPALQLLACVALVVWPGVNTAAASLILFRSFEYSLFRDTKELFYMDLSFEVRYRTKLLLDVFGHRAGKAMLAAALGAPVLANTRLVALSPTLAAAAATCWLGLAVGMVWTRRESVE